MDLVTFVLAALPRSPARVLEIGCGAGHLARAMDAAGHRVLAIDPEAPAGAIFRRMRLEELRDAGPFEAAVASYSLHHIEGVDPAVDRIAELLEPHGCLVIEELAGIYSMRRPRIGLGSSKESRRSNPCLWSGVPNTMGFMDTPRPSHWARFARSASATSVSVVDELRPGPVSELNP